MPRREHKPLYRFSEYYRETSCGCVYVVVDGADVTHIKWCDGHRPILSMTGKIRKELSR